MVVMVSKAMGSVVDVLNLTGSADKRRMVLSGWRVFEDMWFWLQIWNRMMTHIWLTTNYLLTGFCTHVIGYIRGTVNPPWFRRLLSSPSSLSFLLEPPDQPPCIMIACHGLRSTQRRTSSSRIHRMSTVCAERKLPKFIKILNTQTPVVASSTCGVVPIYFNEMVSTPSLTSIFWRRLEVTCELVYL